MRQATTLLIALLAAAPAAAQAQAPQAQPTQPQPESGPRQTQQDEYTRYELLAPDTASFAIIYEVSATTPGATSWFNPIRKGSIASDESVIDIATGEPLKFEQVHGAEAKTTGLPNAAVDTDYIRVHLAHPIPADGGQARVPVI